jgi:hypothetical protein
MITNLSAALWDERRALTALADQLDVLTIEVEQRTLAAAAALLPTLDPLLETVRLHAFHRDLLVSCVANEWGITDADLIAVAGNAVTPVWGEILTLHVCAMHETALRMASAGSRIEAVLAGLHLNVLPARWPRSTYPASYLTDTGNGPATALPRTVGWVSRTAIA